MKRDEIPEHMGGDSTLWHRTGSAQVTELVVHPSVEWFEVGGQGYRERAGCKEGGAKSVAWRFRLERIPPRPRGGAAAAAGSGFSRWIDKSLREQCRSTDVLQCYSD
jgi:hypothetical protein